jgi:hypothetical protein
MADTAKSKTVRQPDLGITKIPSVRSVMRGFRILLAREADDVKASSTHHFEIDPFVRRGSSDRTVPR